MYKKKTESMLCNQKLGEAREHGHFLHKSMGDMKVFLFTFDISLINSVELQGNIAWPFQRVNLNWLIKELAIGIELVIT